MTFLEERIVLLWFPIILYIHEHIYTHQQNFHYNTEQEVSHCIRNNFSAFWSITLHHKYHSFSGTALTVSKNYLGGCDSPHLYSDTHSMCVRVTSASCEASAAQTLSCSALCWLKHVLHQVHQPAVDLSATLRQREKHTLHTWQKYFHSIIIWNVVI